MYKFGRLLSAIVSQNIVIIIAIGLIRALFGVYGWFPDDNVNLLVGPLLNWLVPVLFGYTGGYLLGGKRGGTVAAIVIFGLAGQQRLDDLHRHADRAGDRPGGQPDRARAGASSAVGV